MKKGFLIITLLGGLAACNNNAEVKSPDTDHMDPGTDVTFGADSSGSSRDTAKAAPLRDTMPDTLRVRFPDRQQ